MPENYRHTLPNALIHVPLQKYGSGKTEIQAKVWYLTSVKHYPLYGATFFYVHYKGFWSYPNNLILAVDLEGVKFVNQKSKQVGGTMGCCASGNVATILLPLIMGAWHIHDKYFLPQSFWLAIETRGTY